MSGIIPFLAAPDYQHTAAWIKALQLAMPDEKIVAFDTLDVMSKAACTVAIVANPNPAELRQLPQLRWLHSVWAGVERLLADLGNRELSIVRLVDPQLADTMAEAVLAWTLYLHREMPAYATQQGQQQWQARSYQRPQAKTVGLLGLGVLGEAAARRLSSANFKLCGWSRSRKLIAGVECFAGVDELPLMLAKTDILICLLPLTPETTGLLDAEKLACLPHGAQIINFARGAIICDDALLAALDSGRLKHAVLDVFITEPLPPGQWQWQHPKVTVLPHCSAPTDRETASLIVANNIRAYRKSGEIPAEVDALRGY